MWLVKLVVVIFIVDACNSKLTIISKYDTNELTVAENTEFKQLVSHTIDPNIAEDAKLDTPGLIKKYGYKGEVHHVKTKDGYILQMHRISGGVKSPPRKGKRVCFIQHGLLDSSATWVFPGPHHALGYRLADEGYDVWMGNSRGSTYSCNHTTYDPFGSSRDRKRFWSFSWHEMGIYDLPASIDYVLAHTEQSTMQYIGHSQGTTAFFVMMSEKPEYNHKIQLMHALAPVAYMSHLISPPVRVLAPFVDALAYATSSLNIYYLGRNDDSYIEAVRQFCESSKQHQLFCEDMMFLSFGESDQFNTTLLPVILGHFPAGASTKQFIHYIQEINSGHFRPIDYGRTENLKRYTKSSQPDYKLINIKVPIAMYYSQYDWLAALEDVHRLIKELPNVVHDYLVPHKEFNHVDFLWGIDAPRLVYDEIVKNMKAHH